MAKLPRGLWGDSCGPIGAVTIAPNTGRDADRIAVRTRPAPLVEPPASRLQWQEIMATYSRDMLPYVTSAQAALYNVSKPAMTGHNVLRKYALPYIRSQTNWTQYEDYGEGAFHYVKFNRGQASAVAGYVTFQYFYILNIERPTSVRIAICAFSLDAIGRVGSYVSTYYGAPNQGNNVTRIPMPGRDTNILAVLRWDGILRGRRIYSPVAWARLLQNV